MKNEYQTKAFIRLLETAAVVLILFTLSGCNKHTFTYAPYDIDSNYELYDFILPELNTPYLKKFRKECQLDEITAECKTDIEKVEKLCHWVNGLWKHNGENTPVKNDPLSIVKESKSGANFRCVEYAKVLNASLNSIGISARIIGLKTKDSETRPSGAGHIAIEAYIPSLSKWIFIDAQWDAIPYCGKTPLNAVEFRNGLFHKKKNLKIRTNSIITSIFYSKWISRYLYFLDTRVTVSGRDNARLMLVPLEAQKPKVFQIHTPLNNYVYTNSAKSFYPEP